MAYATNLSVSGAMQVMRLVGLYRRQRVVETAYRSIEITRPWTTSRSIGLRTLLSCASLVVFDLWMPGGRSPGSRRRLLAFAVALFVAAIGGVCPACGISYDPG